MAFNHSYTEVSLSQLVALRNALVTSEHTADMLCSFMVTLAAVCGCTLFYSWCVNRCVIPRKMHSDPSVISPKLQQQNTDTFAEMDEKSPSFDEQCDGTSPIPFERSMHDNSLHHNGDSSGYLKNNTECRSIVRGQNDDNCQDYREMSMESVICQENKVDTFSMGKVYFKSSDSWVEPSASQLSESKITMAQSPCCSPVEMIVPQYQSPPKLIPSTPHTLSINPTTVRKPKQVSPLPSAIKKTNRISRSRSRKRIRAYCVSRAEVLDVLPENISPLESIQEKKCYSSQPEACKFGLSTASAISKLCQFDGNSLFLGNCYAKLTDHQQRVLKAIREDRCNVLKLYKKSGMRFDFNENNPLREAVLSNRIEILKFLYEECGVDLNAESGFAIRWASRKNHVEMVEWLCSIDSLDVAACRGEALAWAKENYHLSVQEIIEGRMKKQKLDKVNEEEKLDKGTKHKFGKIDTTWKWTRRTINKKCLTTETMEFVMAKRQGSVSKRPSLSRQVRDPNFRQYENELNITREIADRSESTQQFTDASLNQSRRILISPIKQTGSGSSILSRKKFKVTSVFAKPVGRGSRSRSRKTVNKISKSVQADLKKDPKPSGKGSSKLLMDAKGLPLATPRTKLKHYCLNAAGRLGTLPCGPPTEHRRKIARKRLERDQKGNRKRSLSDSNPPEKECGKQSHGSISGQNKKGDAAKENCTVAVSLKYYSPPRVKRRKIRPRTDGPITRTQQKGFIDFRDRLFKQGLMSKQIRASLEKEEVEQMMGERRKLRR